MKLLEKQILDIPYFKGITPSEMAYLQGSVSFKQFNAGEILFLEGDRAEGMWVIENGHVKIFRLNQNGDEHIIRLCGPGSSFNDIGAIDRGHNPANAAALNVDVSVWLIPSATIHYIFSNNPEVALNTIQMMASRVRNLVDQIEDLALYSVMVRLARFLLKQSRNPELEGSAITRTVIAAHIHTTPQTISNVLRTLEEAGAIEFSRHHIVIVDEKILNVIAML